MPDQPGDLTRSARIMVALDLSPGEDGLAETLASLDRAGTPIAIARFGTHGLGPMVAPQLPFWLCPLRPGDLLAPDSLAAYAAAALATDKTIIYADDDLQDATGHRHSPHFKPAWNPELHRWHDYLSHSCLLRIDDPAELAEFGERSDWVATLIARRIAADPNSAVHLPQVLHHRRARALPHVPGPQDIETYPGALPSVTVIVPTRNRVELLRKLHRRLARDPLSAVRPDRHRQ